MRRVWTVIVLSLAVVGIAWALNAVLGSRTTATALMNEFKQDQEGAMTRHRSWWSRNVRFEAILRKPPWEPQLIQYKDGWEEALVYFVTDVPGEWLFCNTPYTASLRRLEEGRMYLVTGAVYHFEPEGKLFLSRCTVTPIAEPH